jgi:hypothetical protein
MLTKLIGNKTNATRLDDAMRVCKYLSLYLSRAQAVVLSFKGIHTASPEFLNVAFGQLYGSFEGDFLSKMLSVEDLPPSIRPKLRRAISNAKTYFQVRSKDIQEEKTRFVDWPTPDENGS